MFSDNTVQWIGTLAQQKQVNFYCWMASFGIGVKDSWSEKNCNAYINSKKRHNDTVYDCDLDGYNALGKGKHMNKEVSAYLTSIITEICQSGITDSGAIYDRIVQEKKLPVFFSCYPI